MELGLAMIDSQPSSRFQLVVSDLVMPETGGQEWAKRLHQTAPELQILFISGYPNEQRASDPPPAAPHFLQQPFAPSTLLAEVRRIHDT